MAAYIDVPMVELFPVADVYASGMATPEDIGDGDYRFTFYVNRKTPAGEPERVIVERIVMKDIKAHECARVTLSTVGHIFMRNCECLRKSRH